MSSELAAWLRRQREDRGWTRTELARQLIRAARARGDTSMPGAGNISHNIYRWERGAAIATLEPVLALSPGERTAVQGRRLSAVRAELAQPVYRGSARARGLDEQLAGFAPAELGRLP